MEERTCPACLKPLTRREGEAPSAFARRITCGGPCRSSSRWQRPMNDCIYPSRFGGYVTAPVYLAEFICTRQAARRRTVLSSRWWEQPAWKKVFSLQIILANRLCRQFSPQAVSAALRSPRGRGIYSLNHPELHDMVQEEHRRQQQAQQRLLDTSKDSEEAPLLVQPESIGTVHVRRPGQLSKLRNL